jgi:hypothetical protein
MKNFGEKNNIALLLLNKEYQQQVYSMNIGGFRKLPNEENNFIDSVNYRLYELISNPNINYINKNRGLVNLSDNFISKLSFPKNKIYYFNDSVYKSIENIKIKDKDFNGDIFNKIPNNTFETFILGNTAYRYWVIDGSVYIAQLFCIRNFSDLNKDSFVHKSLADTIDFKNTFDKKQVFDSNSIWKWNLSSNDISEVESVGNYLKNTDAVIQFIQMLVYLKFGDVNIKLLKSNTNSKLSKGNKIKNGLNKDIFIVTDNWNTISIRTEGFSVKSHYRLQACGEGRKDRKHILITEFRKNGYVRKGNGVKKNNIKLS